MKLHEKSLLVNIVESKLLETYEEYYPQGQYNNMFIKYLCKYIIDNTYSGEHDDLSRELNSLILDNPNEFSNTVLNEHSNHKTYTLTDDSGISDSMLNKINAVVKNYPNSKYTILSPNRVQFDVNFGWLPPNTISWLNLVNSECIIDYHIDLDDGILKRNDNNTKYKCIRIDDVSEYDTILFVSREEIKDSLTVCTLLKRTESDQNAVLSRIIDNITDNVFFYELGPYTQSYLSTKESSLIIQIPKDLADSDNFYVFNVSNAVKFIENEYFTTMYVDSENSYLDKFSKFKLIEDKNKIYTLVTENENKINTTLIQYILGDFIWRTSDSKLIAYAQNLVKQITNSIQIKSNGIWTNYLSDLIEEFKENNDTIIIKDDIINKETETIMLEQYRIISNNTDPNESLFNEY